MDSSKHLWRRTGWCPRWWPCNRGNWEAPQQHFASPSGVAWSADQQPRPWCREWSDCMSVWLSSLHAPAWRNWKKGINSHLINNKIETYTCQLVTKLDDVGQDKIGQSWIGNSFVILLRKGLNPGICNNKQNYSNMMIVHKNGQAKTIPLVWLPAMVVLKDSRHKFQGPSSPLILSLVNLRETD